MKSYNKITVDAGFLIQLALLMLVLPIKWLIGVLLAAFFHESAHIIAIKFLNVKLHQLSISAFGARIITEGMQPLKELIAAAAGPIGGIFTILMFPVLPEATVCGIAQTLFNLLPVYPFDGGRCLRCVSNLLFGSHISFNICVFIKYIVMIIMLIIGLFLNRYSITYTIIAVAIVMRISKMN